MRYLLDTPILLDLAGGDRAASALIRGLLADDADLLTSSIVAAEALVLAGTGPEAAVSRILDGLDIEPVGADTARAAAVLILDAAGELTFADALVASHARSLGATVLTRDRPGLAATGALVMEY